MPLLLLAASCQRDPARALEQRLLKEFVGAYPEDVRPKGNVRAFEIEAAPTERVLTDGTRTRVWAYNGQVPGPTLRIRLGETLRVRFKNALPQPSTIHWHGVRLPNSMDGVPGLTQAPVPPGGTFLYEFTPKDAGTFWFHPHLRSSEQVERGLYGVLIVEDREPLPYSQDVVWVLDDWLLDEQKQVFEGFNTRHDLMHDGRWGNHITVNGERDTVLRVRSGDRIRLRLLNSANGRVFLPDFRGIPGVKVIAVDGNYLRGPADAQGFELAPGNRLDLDITFRTDSSLRYDIVDRFYAQRPNRLAAIEVAGIADETPRFSSPARAHVPVWKEGGQAVLATEYKLNSRVGGPLGIEWTLNDHAMHGHNHAHPPSLTLKQGRFARIRFTNDSFRLHPIHLHGMFFRVLSRNGSALDEPFFRDTVLIRARESIDIGVVPLDVGKWMMHCHILEHAEAGMMSVIDVVPN